MSLTALFNSVLCNCIYCHSVSALSYLILMPLIVKPRNHNDVSSSWPGFVRAWQCLAMPNMVYKTKMQWQGSSRGQLQTWMWPQYVCVLFLIHTVDVSTALSAQQFVWYTVLCPSFTVLMRIQANRTNTDWFKLMKNIDSNSLKTSILKNYWIWMMHFSPKLWL